MSLASATSMIDFPSSKSTVLPSIVSVGMIGFGCDVVESGDIPWCTSASLPHVGWVGLETVQSYDPEGDYGNSAGIVGKCVNGGLEPTMSV